MGYMLVGLASIIVLNTANVSPLLAEISGVATDALTALYVYGVALVVATDSPLHKSAGKDPVVGDLFKKNSGCLNINQQKWRGSGELYLAIFITIPS